MTTTARENTKGSRPVMAICSPPVGITLASRAPGPLPPPHREAFDLVNGAGSVIFGGMHNRNNSGGTYTKGPNVLHLFANSCGGDSRRPDSMVPQSGRAICRAALPPPVSVTNGPSCCPLYAVVRRDSVDSRNHSNGHVSGGRRLCRPRVRPRRSREAASGQCSRARRQARSWPG